MAKKPQNEGGAQALWPADKVERWPVERLTPFARNSRSHTDAQIGSIASSIKEWGFTVPILVDDSGTVIAGHARLAAARRLKFTEVPVVVASGWSEAKKRAYVVADNRLAELSSWDKDMLLMELGDIAEDGEVDLSIVGFSQHDMNALLGVNLGETPAPDAGGDNYSEQYGVIVVCDDAGHQERVYNALQAAGYAKLKVVTT